MSRLCVAWKLNLKKYCTTVDKLSNESIISMLSNAKCLNNNENSTKYFFTIFSTMKAFPLRSETCEAAISAIHPSNLVTVFFPVCSANKSLGLSMKGTSVCTPML